MYILNVTGLDHWIRRGVLKKRERFGELLQMFFKEYIYYATGLAHWIIWRVLRKREVWRFFQNICEGPHMIR